MCLIHEESRGGGSEKIVGAVTQQFRAKTSEHYSRTKFEFDHSDFVFNKKFLFWNKIKEELPKRHPELKLNMDEKLRIDDANATYEILDSIKSIILKK